MARSRRSHPSPRKRPSRRAAAHRGRRGKWFWFGIFFKLGLACLFFYGLIGMGYYLYALRFDLRELHEIPERTVVYDRRGQVIGRFGGENRILVRFEEVPEHFVLALLAREDSRFYQHLGVDPIGILRAAARNLLMGGIRQGGSTITQQLARNSFPLGGRTYHRKLLEAALSFRIETEISKEEILESYLNRIYFGSGCYGVETASRTYFDKPTARLTLAESALLAGLIRSPTRLSPLNDPEASLRQRNLVLHRLQELGWITPEEQQQARKEPLRLSQKPRIESADNWVMDIVRRELEPLLERLAVDSSGLILHTTIDLRLQHATEQAITVRLRAIEARPDYAHASRAQALAGGRTDYLQAAAVVLDHRDGGILALAGGRDYATSKFNRALFARRQAGSSIKPFILAQALAGGLSPKLRLSDERLQAGEIPARYGKYDPTNPDDRYDSSRPIEDSVIYSRNLLTVRLGLRAGLDKVAHLLQRAGVTAQPPLFPSLFLGAFETTLRELTAAMTVFPNGGHQVQPFVIREINDSSGRLLYRHRQVRTPLLEPAVCRQVALAMEETVERGTASGARSLGLRGRAAGKTGTTNSFQDAWFVGFTGNITAGVWAGFDQPRTIFSGGGGSQVALPIWVSIVQSPSAAPYR